MMHKVMLIDDDRLLQETLELLLTRHGYAFCGALDGLTGLAELKEEAPDLLLLDIMLPDGSGFDVCRRIREIDDAMPIIFLSARTDVMDKGVAFRAGGDDYITKPFDAEELLIRVEGNIRRHGGQREASGEEALSILRAGDIEVHLDKYQVLVAGEPVQLTTKEFEIVALLAASPGRVFTHDEIQMGVWGETDGSANTMAVAMRRIREKIEENPSSPRRILTVRRVGYKMVE